MEETQGVVLDVCGLSKQYDPPKGILAVDGISFQIHHGEIFSLLGPNGAGKTTTISILCGLLQPTKGDAWIFGHSVRREPLLAKEQVGVVPQEIALYPDLSARENLSFWGKMYGLRRPILKQRVDEVLQIVGLAQREKGRVGKYSGGMKRRLNIGVALLHKPRLIIMDEPTAGIDPQSRRHILDSVKELNREGASVLYTTHYMEEAQELSHRIAIMDHGTIVALGTHQELVKIIGELDRVELTVSQSSQSLWKAWRDCEGVQNVVADGTLATLLVEDSNRVLPHLFEAAAATGVRITSVQIQEPNLESVFLHLTGRALRD